MDSSFLCTIWFLVPEILVQDVKNHTLATCNILEYCEVWAPKVQKWGVFFTTGNLPKSLTAMTLLASAPTDKIKVNTHNDGESTSTRGGGLCSSPCQQPLEDEAW